MSRIVRPASLTASRIAAMANSVMLRDVFRSTGVWLTPITASCLDPATLTLGSRPELRDAHAGAAIFECDNDRHTDPHVRWSAIENIAREPKPRLLRQLHLGDDIGRLETANERHVHDGVRVDRSTAGHLAPFHRLRCEALRATRDRRKRVDSARRAALADQAVFGCRVPVRFGIRVWERQRLHRQFAVPA